MRPRLRKTFPRFPFVYFGNLGKTQIRGQKFFLRRVIEKKQNKIPFLLMMLDNIFLSFRGHQTHATTTFFNQSFPSSRKVVQETDAKKIRLAQNFAINEKSTIFHQSS